MRLKKDPILVIGNEKMAFSIAVCLLHAGHPVTFYTEQKAEALISMDTHFSEMYKAPSDVLSRSDFKILPDLDDPLNFMLAIVVTHEDLSLKRSIIQQLESRLPAQALVAINSESFSLSAIQQNASNPERIIGANWSEPAHTTYFLEIISNEKNKNDLVHNFFSTAKLEWQKDPYILDKNMGIRSRMMSALVREAFYLLENGYVSVGDIDRACRNDAGYYLPFAGNCRYMDLMGTYVYGAVMQDLNPELSKETHIPSFFEEILEQGGEGMKNNKGFYTYETGEVKRRREEFRKFSYEIRQIIDKYPFNYSKETLHRENKIVSNS